jgi:hypothetical protein
MSDQTYLLILRLLHIGFGIFWLALPFTLLSSSSRLSALWVLMDRNLCNNLQEQTSFR